MSCSDLFVLRTRADDVHLPPTGSPMKKSKKLSLARDTIKSLDLALSNVAAGVVTPTEARCTTEGSLASPRCGIPWTDACPVEVI
jgi:hypothetical protein